MQNLQGFLPRLSDGIRNSLMYRRSTIQLSVLAVLALATTGCKISQNDPSKMLAIEISGIPDPSVCEQVMRETR